jgi:hypothetical protein
MNPEELFASIEQKYGLPGGYLGRTYQIESGGGRNLFNPASKAAGPFQFIPSTAKAYGLSDPYDLQASADAAARLAAANRADLQRAGIENPTAAQLYLAHQQGAGGAAKLLSGGENPATSIVGKRAVLLNAGKEGMSGPAFAQQIMAKYEGVQPSFAAPQQGAIDTAREQTAAVDTAASVDQATAQAASQSAKDEELFKNLGRMGLSLMAANQPKQTGMLSPVGNRPRRKGDLFSGGLLG